MESRAPPGRGEQLLLLSVERGAAISSWRCDAAAGVFQAPAPSRSLRASHVVYGRPFPVVSPPFLREKQKQPPLV